MECENHDLLTPYDCLLFDVDDTLYPLSAGLSTQCTINIEEYMIQKLGIDEEKTPHMNKLLYRNYGTSMAGLMAVGYGFDFDDYHSFVHGRLPYQNLKPDPVLRSLLLTLPIRKVIFSNADEVHVDKVLKKLGLEGCFETIVCFESLNPTNNMSGSLGANENLHPYNGDQLIVSESPVICKPFGNAFEQAFKMANINPQRTLFFDDSTRNIQNGKLMGLHTVLVGSSHRSNGADHALESIHNIREAFPELWEIAHAESVSLKCSEKTAIETSVIA
ncbi:hypothetical protein ACFE04_012448 [Oxalis oulophora]